MKKKKLVSLLTVAALVLGAFTGCGSDKKEEKSEVKNNTEVAGNEEIPEDGLVVRLAELDFFRIAQEQGLFDEEFAGENITFEYSSFQGGGFINEAMAADEVDFGAMWEQPAITAIANNYPEEIIATYGYSETNAPLIVTKESGIKSIKDLKGARIGVILGGSFHYTALKYLEQAGLTVDDVELVNTTDPLTLLRSGELEAAVTFNMYANQVIEDGTCEQLAIGSDYNLMAVYAIVANTKFTEKYPDITARILKVLGKSIEFTRANTKDALQSYADFVQQDYDVLKVSYDSSVYELDVTQEDVDAMKQVEQFLEDYDLITTHVDIKDALNLTYLEKAGVEVNDLDFE